MFDADDDGNGGSAAPSFNFGGFTKNLLSGAAFAELESEMETAVKDGTPSASAAKTKTTAEPPASLPAAPDVSGGDAASSEAVAALRTHIAKLEVKLSEKTELCAEKDAQIAATLEEGEQLSIKQAEQEKTIRKLKQSTREAQVAAEKASAELAELRSQQEKMSKEQAEKESALAGDSAKSEAERAADRAELQSLATRHEQLSSEFRELTLQHAQVEAREAVAVEALKEVQLENARLLEAARLRDAGLTSQLGELTARSESAEAHATQLASAVASHDEKQELVVLIRTACGLVYVATHPLVPEWRVAVTMASEYEAQEALQLDLDDN